MPIGSRPAVWEFEAGAVDTPVFDAETLRPGMTIRGPALVEAESTTVVVAPDWSLRVDVNSAFILTHEKEHDEMELES